MKKDNSNLGTTDDSAKSVSNGRNDALFVLFRK